MTREEQRFEIIKATWQGLVTGVYANTDAIKAMDKTGDAMNTSFESAMAITTLALSDALMAELDIQPPPGHAQVTSVNSEGEAYQQKIWDAFAPDNGKEPQP